MNGHARLQSLDESVRYEEEGEELLSLHDCLASEMKDPATAAVRHLDWERVVQSLDRRAKLILVALVEGRGLTLLVHGDKLRLDRMVQSCLGPDILVQGQSRPGWTHTIEAIRQRLACRAERRAG